MMMMRRTVSCAPMEVESVVDEVGVVDEGVAEGVLGGGKAKIGPGTVFDSGWYSPHTN